jgi:hypothetical protein
VQAPYPTHLSSSSRLDYPAGHQVHVLRVSDVELSQSDELPGDAVALVDQGVLQERVLCCSKPLPRSIPVHSCVSIAPSIVASMQCSGVTRPPHPDLDVLRSCISRSSGKPDDSRGAYFRR